MTAVVIDVELPALDPAVAESRWVEFSPDDSAVSRRLWQFVVLMAVRDRATAIDYTPGGPDGDLLYTVESVRYELVPPPRELAGRLVDTARRLTMPGRLAALRWRLAGLWTDRSAAGVVAFRGHGVWSHWAVTVWRAGAWQGVSFRRLDAVTPRPAFDPGPADPAGVAWGE